MAIENNLKTFSVRLPVEICDDIDLRSKDARRTRNAEITNLLEIALNTLKIREAKLKHNETTLS